jgi:type IV secretory pathway VirB10-like protein
MEFNKLVFAGLSVGCLAAAAGGSYLAVRQNQSSAYAVPASEIRTDAVTPEAKTPSPVTETEGVIAPEAAAPEAAPAAPPAPARRAPAVEESRPSSSRAARVVERPAEASARPSSPSTRADRRDATVGARSGPTSGSPADPAPSTSGSMWETRPSVAPAAPEYREPEPPAPPPPPAPEFVDLTVPSDAVLGLQIERTVSSELARVEDRVDARVTRDVRVGDRVAIPAGSTVRGSVSEVDRGGRMKGKARLAIKFHTIVLADGTQLPLKTDAVVREGQSPGGESAAKVGGAAIGGAILGAILGGGKGAAIGGAVGAGAGTAAAMGNDRNPATLAAGTTVTVRVQAPVTVTVQKE